ncbi:SgcJ/EcaC family oxidoreductase [Chromatocurvus halotolerans]|uniref:Limonene-1,2-epoxide hydrolase n=1 Tax=Chromatocurvus halotolerans TaxID=1132028 RepID=A0A4V2SBS6_9GAMM|nr:nuclear transport factor 2 family protein [Chromatocurvus halotolerans]TCO76650.1 limonene-1,2-epoxide hydrolase [Chromatocurvus halotolerans]
MNLTNLKLSLLCMALLAVLALPARAEDPESVTMDMVDAWNDVDLDRVIGLFTPDGVLHSMMSAPVVGRDSLRSHLAPLFAGIEELNLDLKRVVVDGDTVIIERVDEFVFKGKRGAVPVVGVLVIRDGAVAEWREYYDRAQLLSEMGMTAPGGASATAE